MRLLFTITFLLSGLLALSHPMHKSIVNIDFTSDTSCKITIQLTDHDLAEALQSAFHLPDGMSVIQKGMDAKTNWNELFRKYIWISIGEKQFFLDNLKSVHKKGEEIVFVYQLDFNEAILSFELVNSLFTNLFPSQKNLVFVNFDEKVEEELFTSKHIRKTFEKSIKVE